MCDSRLPSCVTAGCRPHVQVGSCARGSWTAQWEQRGDFFVTASDAVRGGPRGRAALQYFYQACHLLLPWCLLAWLPGTNLVRTWYEPVAWYFEPGLSLVGRRRRAFDVPVHLPKARRRDAIAAGRNGGLLACATCVCATAPEVQGTGHGARGTELPPPALSPEPPRAAGAAQHATRRQPVASGLSRRALVPNGATRRAAGARSP